MLGKQRGGGNSFQLDNSVDLKKWMTFTEQQAYSRKNNQDQQKHRNRSIFDRLYRTPQNEGTS
jgi:hypothetical protein